ncbi:hypothetical protein CRM22_002309 [Opisthorchis felineus]|uniref:RNA helicase n=1 Tax=Opisthorchis felineus TaxID=147828 RepID=A0A4S2M6S2_OPIFE|nr:hypothetical protein CRM22_002309 [Opisthorchis felineus]
MECTESANLDVPLLKCGAELTELSIAHELDSEKKRTTDILLPNASGDISTQSTKSVSSVRFSDLHVAPLVLRGLTDNGFSRPSPVQVKAIPLGRMGLDLIVQAKSGTGKTVVFVVVLLESINTQSPTLQALVLCPTREIALQTQIVFQRLGAHIAGLKCQLFVGGLPLVDDLRRLQHCHVAIGTPGRVRYLIETSYMPVDQVRHLVLDEADLLLAGGAEAAITGGSANNAFPADVNYIWWSLPQNKQVIALSATYSDYLAEEHLQRYMNDPALVRLTSHDPALVGVRQFFCLIEPTDRSPASVFSCKVAFLCKLLSSVEFQQCLIFSNFHSSAQDLCNALHSRGWPVSYISSSLDQEERFRAFSRLRAFHCRVLVSTDLTSRGIDAENVNLVISLEVPWEHEIYVHRVGRAGRFGSYGASVLVVANLPDETRLLQRLQNKCATKICQLPDPVPADLAAPDCPLDLDSLVTVVSCLKGKLSEEPTGPHNTRMKPTKRLTEQPTQFKTRSMEQEGAHKSNDSTKPTTFQNASPCKESVLKLATDLSDYVSSFQSLLFQQCEAASDCVKSTEKLHELEEHLLEHLDELLVPPRFTSPSEDVIKAQKTLPRKEPPKHVKDVPSVNAAEGDVTFEQANGADDTGDFVWTKRQLSAWNEYNKLLSYLQFYYSSWYSAQAEYTEAVNKLQHLREMRADHVK